MLLAKLVVTAHILLGTPHWTLDVDPTFALDVSMPSVYGPDRIRPGMALPNLVLIDPRSDRVSGLRRATMEHELEHTDQWSALGPGFVFTYAITGGAALEDYQDPHAWKAPRDLRPCPLLRFDAHGATTLPCWRPDTPATRAATTRDRLQRGVVSPQVAFRASAPHVFTALGGVGLPARRTVAASSPVSRDAIALNVPPERPGLNEAATRR